MQSSPFDGVHRQLGARFDNYDGWTLPADFGNVEAETSALNSHCAAVDLCSFGRIQVRGSQVKDALESVFETKNGSINTDSWVWAKIKTLDLKDILCRVVRTNGDFLLLTQPAETGTVCEKLDAVTGGGVEVSDVTRKTAMLGLYGPRSFDSMRGVLPFDIDHLDLGDAAKMSFMMMPFTLIRGSWLAGEGLELICPAAAGPLAAGAVAKYRHKHNITPAGMNCLREAMSNMSAPL
jgi:aminomethyltransferase